MFPPVRAVGRGHVYSYFSREVTQCDSYPRGTTCRDPVAGNTSVRLAANAVPPRRAADEGVCAFVRSAELTVNSPRRPDLESTSAEKAIARPRHVSDSNWSAMRKDAG